MVKSAKKCLKCGYIRQPSDQAPEYECPQCGAIYAKVEEALAAARSRPKRRQPPPAESNWTKPILILLAIGILWGILDYMSSDSNYDQPTNQPKNTLSEPVSEKNNACSEKHYAIEPGETKQIELSLPLYAHATINDPVNIIDEWKDQVIVIDHNGQRLERYKDNSQWTINYPVLSLSRFEYPVWVIKLDSPRKQFYNHTYHCDIVGHLNRAGLLSVSIRADTPASPPHIVGLLDREKLTAILNQCMPNEDFEIEKIFLEGKVVRINTEVYLSQDINQKDYQQKLLRIIHKEDKKETPMPIGPYSIPITLTYQQDQFEVIVPRFEPQCSF